MLNKITFYFTDLNKDVINVYSKVFEDLPNFIFKRANITSQKGDVIVSPANSYGQMDGGVDRAINYSLDYISEDVQKLINELYYGEQPVGTCLLIPTFKTNYHYLAHTPTMRIPQDVNNTLNAYYAFRSLLIEILNHNKKCNDIKSIVITSFCCGAGKMDKLKSAKQMRLAYDLVNKNLECSWMNSNTVEQLLEKLI